MQAVITPKISVALVDDCKFIRDLVTRILGRAHDFELLFSFDRAEDAITTLPACPVQIVLLDIQLPGVSGIDCLKNLRQSCPDTLFVMYTVNDEEQQIVEAVRAGALGYLLKETDPKELPFALRELYNGGSPMSTTIARRIIYAFQNSTVPSRPQVDDTILTDRERELLHLLSHGYRYKEIAEALFISIETVRRHCQNIYKKLQVQGKVEAINKVYARS